MNLTRRAFLRGLGAGALAWCWSWRARAQEPLRLSLPPLEDVLPLGYAAQQGLFEAAGLAVELVGISSRRERNAALLSGNLDGVMSDLSSVLFNLANVEAEIAVTSTAFEAVDGHRQLALLASGFHHIGDLDALFARLDARPQNSIVLSRRTDWELVTDELLASRGITVDPEVHYNDTDDLVNAATLLVAGSVLAAVLPEPLAVLTEKNDLIEEPFRSVALDDFQSVKLPPSVLVFRRETIEARADELAGFYEVYRQAIDRVNTAGKDLLLEIGIDKAIELFLPGLSREELPLDFGEFVTVPTYPQPRTLQPEEFDRVAGWAFSKDYLQREVPFEQAVDFRFLSAA